ncbi:MAG: sugar phosphate isomerase/epimerase [Ruminococcaceae bacterium]|jgi:sugar phosphate isomerase/epimerase|nr:sugar phosphate isomerase/epimerase [Oscillospiraceae bacterium]
MNIGLIMSYRQGTDLLSKFRQARELELDSCQLSIWDSSLYTDEQAEIIRNAVQQTGLAISALWAGWGGPMEWNFTAGPATLGLVPVSYRSMRLNDLMLASAFAVKIGVQDIATHVGFLPENPDDPNYNGVISALRSLVRVMKERDQYFLFETGQETPVTLLRAIEDIGTDNLGINFDMANLLLYGKANPADALDVFGRYVRNVHCKDGDYPTDGRNLGREKALGQGRVNLPLILKKLKALGYDRALTIEREISGPEQIRDIKAARQLLLELLDTV